MVYLEPDQPMKLKLYKIDQFDEEELVLDEESSSNYSSSAHQRIIDVIDLPSGV